ncbi:VCBS repeat-containing protein [Lysobacter sp. K5869]|uniref:FG-GAP repeat domain-containing protein n=1 Tax=Lysobacter sp. K5869 TaxID=2820808 RepID=UPI001C05FE0E|nr:VCBS repeat-containing protein [Lysobacter sp. K5869]QWP75754.1 VCBS repeat-containing protein [Lysobacter sp. K5869]
MRGWAWKIWIGVGFAGLVAVFSWPRAPAAAAAQTPAPASAPEAAPIGGAPAPQRAADDPRAPSAAPAGGAGGYALVPGPRYRSGVADPNSSRGGGERAFVSVAVGDVDGDGRDDLVATTEDGSVQVFAQKPQGGLRFPPRVWSAPNGGGRPATSALLVDLNGDGAMDVVVAREAAPASALPAGLDVLLSDGRGGLSLRRVPVEIGAADELNAMDVDQDGREDLVALVQRAGAAGECARRAGDACTRVRTLYGDGQGGIREIAEAPLGGPSARVVGVLDFDGDGRRDLIYREPDAARGGSRLLWRPQLAEGGLGEASPIGSLPAWPAAMPALGDFDGDGRADLLVGSAEAGMSSLSLRSADGGFAAARPYPGFAAISPPQIADFDGDGRADVVSVQHPAGAPGDAGVLAYQAQRDGAPAAPQWRGASRALARIGAHGLVHGDFNGDGCRDVAVAAGRQGVWFYYGRGCAPAPMGLQNYRFDESAPRAAPAPAPAGAAAPMQTQAQAQKQVRQTVLVQRQARGGGQTQFQRQMQARRSMQYQRQAQTRRSPSLQQRTQFQRQGQGQTRRGGGLPRRFTTAPARTPMRLLRAWRKR